jgi:hypothetical protein
MAKDKKFHEEIISTLKAVADEYIEQELGKRSSRIPEPTPLGTVKTNKTSLVTITAANLVKTMTSWNPAIKKIPNYNVDTDVLITANPEPPNELQLTMSDDKDDAIVKNFYGGEVEIGDQDYKLNGKARIDISNEFIEDVSNIMIQSLKDMLAKEVIKRNKENREKRRKT